MSDLDLGATIKGLSAGQTVFGRFKLVKIVGRGGMGVVWQAHDEELERDVALKFLPEVVALDREAVNDLKRETRRALELTHPRIVRIFDFVQDERSAAISMEFVDGSSLAATKLEQPNGHFEVETLTPLVRQLCEALCYAHDERKVIHRDLKPANLMVNSRGELKITDFGISATVADSTTRISKATGTSGTPVYMSPQQMMGEKPAVTDDVYSLGATLYELLTGKPPFYSGNVLLQVQSKTPPPINERRAELGVTGEAVPPAWEEAILACLAKEPEKRPASIASFAVRLGLIRPEVARNPVAAAPETAGAGASAGRQETGAFWPAARRVLWASLAAATLLSAGGLAWYLTAVVPQNWAEETRAVELQRKAVEFQARKREVEEQRRQRLAYLAKCREEIVAIKQRINERQLTPDTAALLDRYGGADWQKINRNLGMALGEATDLEAMLAERREAEAMLPGIIAAARQKQLQDGFRLAQQEYQSAVRSVQSGLLSKWGGDRWRVLQSREAAQRATRDYASGAAFYREAVTDLAAIVREANSQAVRQEEQARRQAENEQRQNAARQRAAEAAATQDARATIKIDPSDTGAATKLGIVLASPSVIEVFIDGTKKMSGLSGVTKVETVFLKPGSHVIEVQSYRRGVITAGFKMERESKKYEAWVAGGVNCSITVSIGGQDWGCGAEFSGFSNVKEID